MRNLLKFRPTAMASLAIALTIAGLALLYGQTQIAPRQLGTIVQGGIVFVIAPDGKAQFARLDPSLELVSDATTNGALILRAKAQASVDRVAVFNITAAASTITLPSTPQGNSLQIAANGAVLSEPNDYTRAGLTVTFVPFWAPKPGDTIQVRYRE